jgi:2-polyprenyl-3-methyl-5-hydroxy-6-metoxy-1,4-benzoquinol methylase
MHDKMVELSESQFKESLINRNPKLVRLMPMLEGMQLERVHQCWCNGDLEPWLPEFVCYARCKVCGSKIATYQLTEESNLAFYSEMYWTLYQEICDCPSFEERFDSDMVDRIPVYLEWIQAVRKPPALILEIGCGNGRLLYELKQLGYTCEGIEMDPRVSGWVEARTGVHIHSGSFFTLPVASYDVILAIDLVEHLSDQYGFIQRIQGCLNKGGGLIAHVPIINSDEDAMAQSNLFNPLSHVVMHTSHSFEKLLSRYAMRSEPAGHHFGIPAFYIFETR